MFSVAEMTMSVFQSVSLMVTCVSRHRIPMAWCSQVPRCCGAKGCRRRGGHYPNAAHHSVSCWSQTGLWCAINDQPPTVVPGGDLAKSLQPWA